MRVSIPVDRRAKKCKIEKMGLNVQSKENDTDSEHSAQSVMYATAMRISNIGTEMVVPPLIGIGLDRLFGTVVLFVILGAFLGMFLVFRQLLKIARRNN